MPARGIFLLASVCLAVVVCFALLSEPVADSGGDPASAAFNEMVDGFRAGQLNLKREVPPGLLALSDPYDASMYARFLFGPHNLADLSYYRGKLYLYLGPTPALVLFWPYRVLTGHYLSDRAAAAVFCSLGFLAEAVLLLAFWRRYAPRIGASWVAVGIVALGFATGVPAMLQTPGFHEVSLGCSHAFAMAALVALWLALHRPAQRRAWLAGASFLYGLAAAARPSLVMGAGILLLPAVLEWRSGAAAARSGRIVSLLGAGLVPLALLGAAVMEYNVLRFHQPFEFGQSYMLAGNPHGNPPVFSLDYAGFNLRMYFLAASRLVPHFPFLHQPLPPPLPPGHHEWRGSIGILPNFPIVCLALAFPALFRTVPRPGAVLAYFGAALAIVFAGSAALLACYGWTFERYEVDFLPALALLAVLGGLGWLARLPAAASRRVFGGVFLGLAAWSAVAGLLNCGTLRAEQWGVRAANLLRANRLAEALASDRRAVRLDPDSSRAHAAVALTLEAMGRTAEALDECHQALLLRPGWAEGHMDLGAVLARAGRLPEAIAEYREALRLDPTPSDIHNNLGIALARSGRLEEAAAELEKSRQLGLDSAALETNIGNIQFLAGRPAAAVARYEAALRLDPDYAGARENLAAARRMLAAKPPISP